jgi:hypothetical protein
VKLSAEKRRFLLDHGLSEERVRQIEADDDPSPEAGYKKTGGQADVLFDLAVAFKKAEPTPADPILGYINDLKGRRRPLNEAQKEALQSLVESDPIGATVADLFRGRFERG